MKTATPMIPHHLCLLLYFYWDFQWQKQHTLYLNEHVPFSSGTCVGYCVAYVSPLILQLFTAIFSTDETDTLHLKFDICLAASMAQSTAVSDNWTPVDVSHGFCSAGFVGVVISLSFILPLMVWDPQTHSWSKVSRFCLCFVRTDTGEAWNFSSSPAQTSQGFTGHRQYRNV